MHPQNLDVEQLLDRICHRDAVRVREMKDGHPRALGRRARAAVRDTASMLGLGRPGGVRFSLDADLPPVLAPAVEEAAASFDVPRSSWMRATIIWPRK